MNLENFPSNETAQRMLRTISNGFYDNSYIGKWLFQVMGMELDDAKKIFEELPLQVFPETASWGIAYHEQKFGVLVNDKLPVEKRRAEILRRRDIRAPMNPERIRQIVKGISGTDVMVSENVAPYMFGITLVLSEDSSNVSYEDIRNMVRRVKPSHLSFVMDGGSNTKIYIDIRYNSSLTISSAFYPRFNIPPLLLNGLSYLDGRYILGGFATENAIDLYPMMLSIKSKINCLKNPFSTLNFLCQYIERMHSMVYPVIRAPCVVSKELQFNNNIISWLEHREVVQNKLIYYSKYIQIMAAESRQFILVNQCKTMIKSNQSLFLLFESMEKMQSQTTLYVSNEINCHSIFLLKEEVKADVLSNQKIESENCVTSGYENEIKYGNKLTIEKDLWFLDDSSSLDGSHGLNPQIYNYEI